LIKPTDECWSVKFSPLGHTTYEEYFITQQGDNKQPNIIIIFAESLSPVDSLRVGKINDRLPYFDSISQEGTTFTNYINNGCTSDTAHIALLRGVEALDVASYTGYQAPLESLPAFLRSYGYDTTFLSTVPLSFLNQRDFLKEMDFDQIIGEEAFSGQKHYVFDAAPDEDLYTKALEILAEKADSPQPYTLMMQTISFHKPYDTPYGTTQAEALRYADETLGRFYKLLKLSHFFDTGILIIVGDHRKMENEEKGEKEALGEMRYTK
jgi:phosphoglycerol transferase MdoB-like AlkP superfamily enzyme